MLRCTWRCLTYISIDQVAQVVKAKLAHVQGVEHMLLVDVRSTEEVAQCGMIPSAVCIPLPILRDMLTSEKASDVMDEEFESAVGVPRPQPHTTQLIFYCAHGVRSAIAVDIAEELGFRNPRNFSGSWAQWTYTYGTNVPAPVEAQESLPDRKIQ